MSPSSTSNSSSQACLNCRSKHLRCDGIKPCARCLTALTECVFVRSRRGMVGGRRKPISSPASISEVLSVRPPAMNRIPTKTVSQIRPAEPVQPSGPVLKPEQIFNNTSDHSIELYYHHVHPAHPFLIPEKLYREDPTILPDHLKDAINFITSNILGTSQPDANTGLYILKRCLTSDLSTIQTCLILTIASYARFERDCGDQALCKAIQVAYEIGLQEESFGLDADPIRQESWRRTWWELYCINSLVSLLTPSTTRLPTVWEKQLPGHDHDYAMLNINATGYTLDDMQDRIMANDDVMYSSFAYRIEAARILNDVLDIDKGTVDSALTVTSLNATIQSFLLSMPGLSLGLATDELRCCSLMTINLASIMLHLPRSGLNEIHNFQTICGIDKETTTLSIDQAFHRSAALSGADAITGLLITRNVSAGSMKTISPCFSCALAISTRVQLASYIRLGTSHSTSKAEQRRLKEYVQVNLSALDVIGRTWNLAQLVKCQLAGYAKELLTERKRGLKFAQALPRSMEETTATPALVEFEADFPAYATLGGFVGLSSEDEAWLNSFVEDPNNFQFACEPQGSYKTEIYDTQRVL